MATELERHVVRSFPHYQVKEVDYLRAPTEGLSANQVASRLKADQVRFAETQSLMAEWQEYSDEALVNGGPLKIQIWKGVKPAWVKILAKAGLTDKIAIAKNGNGNGLGRPDRDSLVTTLGADSVLKRKLPVVVAVEMWGTGRNTQAAFMTRIDMRNWLALERAAKDDPAVMDNVFLGVYQGSEEVLRVMAFVSEMANGGHSSAMALHHARFMHRMKRMPQCEAFFAQFKKGDKNRVNQKAIDIIDAGLADVPGLANVGFYALHKATVPGTASEKAWKRHLANPEDYPVEELARDLPELYKQNQIVEVGQSFNKALGDPENRSEYYSYEKVKQLIDLTTREQRLRHNAEAELQEVKDDRKVLAGSVQRGLGRNIPTDGSRQDYYRDVEVNLRLGSLFTQAVEQNPEAMANVIRSLNLGEDDELVAQYVLGKLAPEQVAA